MKVSAKCMNHSGCLKAYRGETIELDPGAPLVCPECGKPLSKAGGGAGGAIKVAAVAVVLLVVAVGGVVAMKIMKKGGETVEQEPAPMTETTTPTTTDTPPSTSESPTATTSVTPPSATPMSEPPPPPPPADEPPPAPPVATNEPATDQVRQEVLTRIDKMPNLTPEKKDRLYVSVQRAQKMQKIVEIPFGSGQASMPPASAPQVKKLLEEPGAMLFRDNLTAVFVVLGFADSKGAEQANMVISERRAKAVVDFMEKQCGVRNVTHSVGMGGTNLVDKNNAAKNRIAEIWAVVP